MRKTKREKIIKKLIDEEFGPNLSADELCSEIDFTQRKGIKIVQEERKPFFKRPVFMCLANVCLILVCILSTFLITKSNVYRFDNNNVVEILDDDEIKYLSDNNYKYDKKVKNILYCDAAKLYIFIGEKNNEKFCFVKYELKEKSCFSIRVNTSKDFVFDRENDFCTIGKLNENNTIEFQIEYNNIINIYSMQFNK